MINTPLLEEVLGNIEMHPEQHDQTWFFQATDCGTAMCFAGWTCDVAGYNPQWNEYLMSANVRLNDGPSLLAWDVARGLLGLTQREATILFAPCNTLDMLQHIVKDLANGTELRELDSYLYPAEPARMEEM
jgi:hypothetical protein